MPSFGQTFPNKVGPCQKRDTLSTSFFSSDRSLSEFKQNIQIRSRTLYVMYVQGTLYGHRVTVVLVFGLQCVV